MRNIFKSGDYIEAQLVLGLLQSYGLDAEFLGTYLVGGVGELPAADLYTIRVPKSEFTKANEVITAYQNGEFEISE